LRGRKWDKQNRSNEGFARPGHLAQDRQAGATPFLLNKSHLEKNNAALPPVWEKAHEVGGRKYVDFHRIGRLIRECLPPGSAPVLSLRRYVRTRRFIVAGAPQ
jgi:hypothetical protein